MSLGTVNRIVESRLAVRLEQNDKGGRRHVQRCAQQVCLCRSFGELRGFV